MISKKPLNKNQIKSLRKLVEGNELHELLLNIGCDAMLRSPDLLSLKVKDVVNEDGSIKESVKERQQKTKNYTLDIPLSKNSQDVIKKYLVEREKDSRIFVGNKSHYTKSPITQKQYSRIVKGWVSSLGISNVGDYSTHSIRKTKSSLIYQKTKNVEVCRRLLIHSNVTATSAYLGIEDSDALEVARNIKILLEGIWMT